MRGWSGREIGARGAVALVGGYGITALWCAVVARLLPMSRVDATLTATMLSFPLYAGAAIWAFAARSLTRLCATGALVGLLGLLVFVGASL